MTPTFLQRIRGVRDFRHGPRQLVVNLALQRRNQVFHIAGNLFYVWSSGASSDYIDVKFHDIHEPTFRFHAGQGMVLPFERFIITTPAGQTGNMIILYGQDAPEALYPLDARTAAMDLLTASRNLLQSIDGKFDDYLTFDIPMTNGFAWTDASPTPDAIAWSAGRVVYQGGNYDIAAGSTAQPYVYWDPADPGVFVGTGNPAEAIAGNRWVMAFNSGGAAQPAFASKLIHGGLIQAGTITADMITTGTLVADVIDSPTLAGLFTPNISENVATGFGSLQQDASETDIEVFALSHASSLVMTLRSAHSVNSVNSSSYIQIEIRRLSDDQLMGQVSRSGSNGLLRIDQAVVNLAANTLYKAVATAFSLNLESDFSSYEFSSYAVYNESLQKA